MTQELIEFKIGNIVLQEPMALITNWMMTAFCFYAYYKLRNISFSEVVLWRRFFFWFVITSFFGGLGHLFFQQFGFLGKYPNWITSIFAGYFAGLSMLFNLEKNKGKTFLKVFLFVKGLVLVFLAIYTRKFIFIAVDAILTYVIYCGFIGYFLSKRLTSDYKYMYLGVLICIPSVFIFVFQINLHKWLNKDDLSHFLMLFCLIFFYLGSKARIKTLSNQVNLNKVL